MPQSGNPLIQMGISFSEPEINPLYDPLFSVKDVQIFILRLDQIHPVVSGNKIFKLYYWLEEARRKPAATLLTYGGAYSNHLSATAFACRQLGIRSVGIVRGERPEKLSHTLQFCLEQGMQLLYVDRAKYHSPGAEIIQTYTNECSDTLVIPEGGYSVKGKLGASLIGNYFRAGMFSHVCLPVGTATTLAGVVEANSPGTRILGFSVLKNLLDIGDRLRELEVDPAYPFRIVHDYHFGGYAKKKPELLDFINRFYESHSVPLDFVYTGKMMFGVFDMVRRNYFKRGSKILCIHTGGLQGNRSLPTRALRF